MTQVFDDLIFQFLRVGGAIVEVLGRLVVATWAVKEAPGHVKAAPNPFPVDEVKGFVIGDVLL